MQPQDVNSSKTPSSQKYPEGHGLSVLRGGCGPCAKGQIQVTLEYIDCVGDQLRWNSLRSDSRPSHRSAVFDCGVMRFPEGGVFVKICWRDGCVKDVTSD